MRSFAPLIAADPRLAPLQERLAAGLSLHTSSGYSLNPLLVIALISLAIQIIVHCREKRSPEQIRKTIKQWPMVFGFQAGRFRRGVRQLLNDNHLFDKNLSAAVDVALNTITTVTDAELDSLLELAEQ